MKDSDNKIYKYEPMNTRALMNLKSQAIYFNLPSNFNDPYDCNMKIQMRTPNSDEVPYILKSLKDELNCEHKSKLLDEKSDEGIAKMGMDLVESRIKKHMDEDRNSTGVCCFTTSNENLLMWSHYATSGTGFCLAFDSRCEPFDKLREVEYVESPIFIDYKKAFSSDEYYFLDSLLCTKSIDWKYESEWRLLHPVNTAYHYSAESLTDVYFGPESEPDFIEVVCLILQCQNPKVRFHKGFRSESLYKVEFDEIHP